MLTMLTYSSVIRNFKLRLFAIEKSENRAIKKIEDHYEKQKFVRMSEKMFRTNQFLY